MAEESAVGIRVIKAFGRESDRSDRFGATARHAFDRSMDAAHLRALYEPLMGFLPILGLGVVLVYGGILTIDGEHEPGRVRRLLPLPHPSDGALPHASGCWWARPSGRWPAAPASSRCSTAEPDDRRAGLPHAPAGRRRQPDARGRLVRLRPGHARGAQRHRPRRSRPGARWRSSARRDPARAPSPSSSRASTTSRRAACWWTASTCATSPRRAAAGGRDGLPGPVPLLHDGPREHRLRAAGGDRRRGAPRGADGPGRGLHRRPARRLRHRGRRARAHALGRPAPAPGDRAGAHHRPADPDPRRGDGLGGRVDRARDPGGAGGGDGGAHHDRDRPPPLDRCRWPTSWWCSRRGGSSPAAPTRSSTTPATSTARSTTAAWRAPT